MPSVLVAPDSFKGPLTAAEMAAHVMAGLLRARPGLDVAALPGARIAREQLG
jgi:glycerate 2-kinase